MIEVAWSPHTQARLVSVSYDFSGQVWDVAAGAPLHNFSGHSGRVMCTVWHPTMAGMVLTGGEDGVLYCWDPTMQERTLPKERKKERRNKGMGSGEVKEAKEEAKAKPAVASSGDMSFEALLAKHRAQQSKTKEVEIEDVRESEMDAKEALEAKAKEKKVRSASKKFYFPLSTAGEMKKKANATEDCFVVHEL